MTDLDKFTKGMSIDKLDKEHKHPLITELNTITGVYVLIFVDKVEHDTERKHVERLLGKDTDKIAYIGHAGDKNSLLTRLRHFYNCASNCKQNDPKEPVEGHTGGQRYFKLLKTKIGEAKESLHFRYFICRSTKDAQELEKKMLMEYAKTFGELPPLNYQLPK